MEASGHVATAFNENIWEDRVSKKSLNELKVPIPTECTGDKACILGCM